jgi:two-component sensor histidine kinase
MQLSIDQREEERLKALYDYQILDTEDELEFDNLAKLAAQICDVPLAQINFLEEERQWSKSNIGIPFKEMPRAGGFCNYTIKQDRHMIVENTTEDDRFKELPFVANDPSIRFYAGYTVKAQCGPNIGTICVLGFEPKSLSESQIKALETLASEVEGRLELHRQRIELKKSMAFLESSVDLKMELDIDTLKIDRLSGALSKDLPNVNAGKVAFTMTDLFPAEKLRLEFQEWIDSRVMHDFRSESVLMLKNGSITYVTISASRLESKILLTAKDISESTRYQHKLERYLKEKEVLLGEVNHRVKNNLAVISGFLQLEELKAETDVEIDILNRNFMRVKSMALVHDALYQEENLIQLDFDKYLNRMIDETLEQRNNHDVDIRFNRNIEPISLNINQALPCALIINELISNAYEFAFTGKDEGEITISLSEENGEVTLSVKDDGIGFPTEMMVEESPTLGATLVLSFSEQLKSNLKVSSENGAAVELSFTKNDSLSGTGANVMAM